MKQSVEAGMQNILRQTLLRRTQLAKRARRANLKQYKQEQTEYRQAQLQVDRAQRQSVKNERRSRREDWMAGPLAPKRDVGEQKGIYGTVSDRLLNPGAVPKRERIKKENMVIVVGDRVVIVKGADRGRIGEVSEVNIETGMVQVKGLRTVDIKIPSWTPQAKSTPNKHTAVQLPIPLSEVRLVATLEDDADTSLPPRDVVVRHIDIGAPHIERSLFDPTPAHTRYVAGTKITIPWPKPTIDEPIANDGDTRRLDVEDATYVPGLDLVDALPEGVIDELRNPYSRTRGAHDEDFVKRKVLVDMRRDWERRRARVGLLPREEYWAVKREEGKEGWRRRDVSEETRDIIEKEMGELRVQG